MQKLSAKFLSLGIQGRKMWAIAWLLAISIAGCQGRPSGEEISFLSVEQPAANEKRVTFAVYNVENLFDVFDNPYTSDEVTDVKPRSQIGRIAAAIRKMNADVVGLVEVENEGVVRALVSEFLPEMGYRYIGVLASNDERGICNGVISRYPIVEMTTRRWTTLSLPDDSRKWRFARDLVEAKVQLTPDLAVDFFVTHFKSKGDSEGDPQSAAWRLSEAVEARRVIEERVRKNPSAWVLMGGDFNDTLDSATMKTLLSPAGRDGLRPLADLHAKLPEEKRMTYLRGRHRGSTIDFILASPQAARHVVEGSAKVFLEEQLLGGADHAPVMATFRMPQPNER